MHDISACRSGEQCPIAKIMMHKSKRKSHRRDHLDRESEASLLSRLSADLEASFDTVDKFHTSGSGSRFVKGRWRGQQRQKRLKLLEQMPEELIVDAPIGKYLIDEIALRFRNSVGTSTDIDKSKLLKQLRNRVSIDAAAAMLEARWYHVWVPEARRRTQRFFDDLKQIQFLIDRNKSVKSAELAFSTELTGREYRGGSTVKRIARLRNSLSDADVEIKTYVRMYRLPKVGGNKDRFTRCFILALIEAWRCILSSHAVEDEYRQFEQFVWAAWQDVELPTISPDGRSIRKWLADRLRKEFPHGLPKSRRAVDAAWVKTLR